MAASSNEYENWRIAPFPVGSDDDELSDLAADLAMMDAGAADFVVPLRERGTQSPLPPHLIERLMEIANRAENLSLGAGDAGNLARQYRDYALLTARVVAETAASTN